MVRRHLKAEATDSFKTCDLQKLVPLLPPQSDRVVGLVLGNGALESIKKQRGSNAATTDTQAQPAGVDSMAGVPEETSLSSPEKIKSAGKPQATSKPVTVLQKSKNERTERKVRENIEEGQLLEAVSVLLESDAFEFDSQDDIELYKGLAEDVISSSIGQSRLRRSHNTHELLQACLNLASTKYADLPELHDDLKELLPKLQPAVKEPLKKAQHFAVVTGTRGRGRGKSL